jgi:amino acid adenylation domain-containing protein
VKPDSASTHRAAAAANGDVMTTEDRGSQLVAAVAALLQRYTDRSELTIGYATTAAGAPRPIRLDLSGNPRFDELVEQVRTACDTGEPPTDHASALDAVIALDQDPAIFEAHGLWVSEHQTPDGAELRVRNEAGDGGLRTADRLAGHLRTMLESAADDGEQTIAELAILTDNEQQQLLVDWNATESPYPNRCLHELIAEQAQLTPDAVAVRCAGHDLTYRELDLRANRLAHHLVGLGVRPEVLVGICVERSLEMVVGLLGILKAGGAYVPVDPAYPTDRQSFMLTNSEAPVIVTQERLLDGLPLEGLNVVCLDRDWPAIDALPAEAPEVQSDPEQLAYVIYTSGSTGQPKGVQIPHQALVNFLETMRQTPGLAGDDVLVAVTTLSFDIAGLELYLPLIVGARVVVATADTVTDPRGLAQLLETNSATVMQATPTTWRMLLDSGWTGTPGLKVLCGGEALPVALADRLVAADLELWNMYGPTETTIWSTCANVRTQGEGLTIGRPIANTFLYILDGGLAPVPVGVDGELWIGGDGLARGYRGRPDLTEERFVPNPFVAEDDARMYHTGDLARYRPDGTVEFLGRIDHQVKVRGFRIELGEIETVLARHPGIAEAVVIARGDTTAEAELSAYVIPHADAVASHELREYAGESLPAYMVPSTVTTLDAFPLTPNGKVDRKALPEPTRERSGERELVAPTTPLEIRLTEIWERELGISPIGVTDDFFDLGVTSIVAATLFAAIEHELGGELPLGAIFQAPTIRALAELLEGSAGASRWTSLIPIQPHGSKPPIFCIHGGAGTILHLAALSRRLGPDQPFYGLQSRGLYGGAAPLTTVEEMATHYLSEMRQVWPSGPWYIAGYCFGTIVAFELAQRLTAHGEDVRLLAMFNGPSPTWIKRWGWHGNQPSWLAKHPRAPQATTQQRHRGKLAAIKPRLRRALREPKRFWTALGWYLWEPRTRLALALGRPIPEQLREKYFLQLHAKAEKAYDPPVYPGEVILFYGEGLYEDPTLGWEAFAAGGLRSYGVPGEHDSNRQAMMEPAVGFVSEKLQAYLDEVESGR